MSQDGGSWEFDTRRLLRRLRRPSALEREAMGMQLRDRLGTGRVADAVQLCVERALRGEDRRLGEIVRRCDIAGEPTKAVAADLHVSARQFFRYRSAALAAIAQEMRRLIERPSPAAAASSEAVRALGMAELLLGRHAAVDADRAIVWAQRALREDPTLHRAWSLIALAEVAKALASTETAESAYRRAFAASDEALALAPSAGFSLGVRACVVMWATRDERAARRIAYDALQTEDGAARAHYILGWMDALGGDHAASETNFNAALARNPHDTAIRGSAMACIFLAGDHARSAELCRDLLELQPDNAYVLGYYAEALNALDLPEACVAAVDDAEPEARGFSALIARGVALARVGDVESAHVAAESLQVPAVSRAALSVAAGDADAAWRFLEAATHERNGMLELVPFDPVFAPISGEARLRRLLRESRAS